MPIHDHPHYAQGSAQVVFAEPALGCSNNLTYNITNGPQFAGKWAVFDRGLCNFTTKLEAAIFFNALGVVVVNSDGRDWVRAGVIGCPCFCAPSCCWFLLPM